MNNFFGGVLGKPNLSTKKTAKGTLPLGYKTYFDKDAVAPSGFLAITNTTLLDPATYPDLAKVIPAGPFLSPSFFDSPQNTVRNPELNQRDEFGYSVAISGDYAIVGARNNFTSNLTNSGVAYIFFRSGTTWTLQATLTNPVVAEGDQFGFSVAISGDYAVVGAPFVDISGVSDTGSVYVYVRSGTSWTLHATIPNPAAASGDKFGNSVGISGDYMVVGAAADTPLQGNLGSVYIYFRSGTTWSLQASFNNTVALGSGFLGTSVSISGDYVIAGAPSEDPSNVTNAGAAFIYFRSGTTWSLQATLTNPESVSGDSFGFSVAISGDYAVIGAANDDPAGVADAGSAYIYVRSGTNWSLQATLPNPQPNLSDIFGYSVAISGDYAIVGAPFDDRAGVADSGSAYIYVRSGTTWSLQTTLLNPSSVGSDTFGFSVGISGNYTIVGAPLDTVVTNEEGTAYIYSRFAPSSVVLQPLPSSAEHKTLVKVLP